MSAADMLDQDHAPTDEPVTAHLGIGPPPAPQVAAPTAGAEPGDPFGPADELPEVPEPVVRGILASAGTVLAMTPLADPDVPEHWNFTTAELDALTPPLTRIVNARPALRQAAAHGDEVTVLVQLFGYGGRNLITGSMAKNARASQTEEWEHGHEPTETFGAPPGDHRPTGNGPVPRSDLGTDDQVGAGIYPPVD